MDLFLIIKNLFALIGVVLTFYEIHELIKRIKKWREERKKKEWLENLLETHDCFIAQIVHIGGPGSTKYSLQIYSDHDNIYFNPPEYLIDICYPRNDELFIISPSNLSKKFGFVIDSVSEGFSEFKKVNNPEWCHLGRNSIRNVYLIKFVKSNNINVEKSKKLSLKERLYLLLFYKHECRFTKTYAEIKKATFQY